MSDFVGPGPWMCLFCQSEVGGWISAPDWHQYDRGQSRGNVCTGIQASGAGPRDTFRWLSESAGAMVGPVGLVSCAGGISDVVGGELT